MIRMEINKNKFKKEISSKSYNYIDELPQKNKMQTLNLTSTSSFKRCDKR